MLFDLTSCGKHFSERAIGVYIRQIVRPHGLAVAEKNTGDFPVGEPAGRTPLIK
jgi:hypothetical protein